MDATTVEERSGVWTRREFCAAGAAAFSVSAASAGRAWAADSLPGEEPTSPPTPPPTGFDPLRALINRTTFGFTRAAYAEAEALGFYGYVESQLDYLAIPDWAMDARLAALDTLAMTSQQIILAYQQMAGTPARQLMEARILRALYSQRQLFERMVEFWTDHFNIDIVDNLCLVLKTADDRDVIRRYALTTFPQLLHASAKSAAMSFYLDNFSNVEGHAQENYARELMELHSLGVDGGYTQQDVEEVARCFTGWNFLRANTGQLGAFQFRSQDHDFGAKVVLGQAIPAGGGVSDGERVLDILAYHPSTARFIATKLCRWFLGYDPPQDIIDRVRVTFLNTGGDIKAMLRTILRRGVLRVAVTPKFKRPLEFVTSLLRATGAEVFNARGITDQLSLLSHRPFGWSPPNGYPDTLEAWGTSHLPRWRFASVYFDGYVPDAIVDVETLTNWEGGGGPGQQAEAINRILTGGVLPSSEVAAVQEYHDSAPPPQIPWGLRETYALASSLPSFQWY